MTATITNDDAATLQELFSRLSKLYYDASASKGFHDHDDLNELLATGAASKVYAELQDSKRLFLIAGEAVEAFEELRAGHGPTETYYSLSRAFEWSGSTDPENPGTSRSQVHMSKGHTVSAKERVDLETKCGIEATAGLFKPEGVPAELADTVIRIFDFCGTRGIDLGGAIIEKAQFNTTREQHHGKQF